MANPVSFPLAKHIPQRAFELSQHRIQTPQGDGLFTPFQPEYRGWWKPHLFRERRERRVTPLSFQELGELFVQW